MSGEVGRLHSLEERMRINWSFGSCALGARMLRVTDVARGHCSLALWSSRAPMSSGTDLEYSRRYRTASVSSFHLHWQQMFLLPCYAGTWPAKHDEITQLIKDLNTMLSSPAATYIGSQRQTPSRLIHAACPSLLAWIIACSNRG